MPTAYPEIPPVGRAERAAPATDPSLTEGVWKTLVVMEAGSTPNAGSTKKAARNAWNPDDPRLTPERDTGNPGFTINWFWVFHPRQWWRLWRDAPRS
jgi:hypothetical protein